MSNVLRGARLILLLLHVSFVTRNPQPLGCLHEKLELGHNAAGDREAFLVPRELLVRARPLTVGIDASCSGAEPLARVGPHLVVPHAATGAARASRGSAAVR